MPAALLEVGFINSEKDNALFDEKFDEIAQAIADGIIDTLNTQGVNASDSSLYRVQVGAFKNARLANNLMTQLKNQGFQATVVTEDGLSKVVVGDFEKLDNAVMTEQRLRTLGYNTFIRS